MKNNSSNAISDVIDDRTKFYQFEHDKPKIVIDPKTFKVVAIS